MAWSLHASGVVPESGNTHHAPVQWLPIVYTHCLTNWLLSSTTEYYTESDEVYTLPKKWISHICALFHPCSNSEVIGSGNFSLVSKGEWSTPSGPCMVAIKHASGNNATLRMLQEAVVMVQLWHPNIVNLLGLLEPQKSVSTYAP